LIFQPVERNNTTAAGTVADMGNDGFNIPVLSINMLEEMHPSPQSVLPNHPAQTNMQALCGIQVQQMRI
jgi:hypothetical protein